MGNSNSRIARIAILISIITCVFSCYDWDSLEPTQVIYSPSAAVSLAQGEVKLSQFLKFDDPIVSYGVLLPDLSNDMGYIVKYSLPNVVNDSLGSVSFFDFNVTKVKSFNFGDLEIFKNSPINPVPYDNDIALPDFGVRVFNVNDNGQYIEPPQIKKIKVLTGNFIIETRLNAPIDGAALVLKFKNIVDRYGQEVFMQIDLNVPFSQRPKAIDGYLINFSNSDSILVSSTIINLKTGVPFMIDKNESIEITFKTDNFKIDYIKGDMGYMEKSLNMANYTIPTIPVDDALKNSTLSFPEVRIVSDINSNLGFPVKILANFDMDGKQLTFKNNDTLKLAKPSKLGMKPNPDSIIIDKKTSNIATLFNQNTKEISMNNVKLCFGARGQDTSEFLMSTSKINMGLNIRVPLIVDIKNLIYQKYVDVSLGSDMAKLEKAILMFKFNNNFSFSSTVNIQFCDEAKNPLFQVKPVDDNNDTVKTIKPASYSYVNRKRVVVSSQSISYYEIPKDNLKKLSSVKTLRFDFKAETEKQPIVLDSTNTLDFNVNVIGKYQDTLKFK